MYLGKTIVFVIAFVLVPISAAPVFSETVKIAYINSDTVLKSSEKYAEAQKQLEKLKEKWREQIESKVQQLRKAQATLQKQRMVLSQSKRKEKQKEIEAKSRELEKFRGSIIGPGGKLEQKTKELMQPIYKRVDKILKEIAQEEGYDFILDASVGTVVYAKPEYNITGEVIDRLNKLESK